MRLLPFALTLAACHCVATSPLLAQCLEIDDRFHVAGVDGSVLTQIVGNIGQGSELVVGGNFQHVGAMSALRVAAFDGANWRSLDFPLDEDPLALAVFDAGTGPELWVGGEGFLSRYDGATWSSVNMSGNVLALHVHDDGTGAALYAGGDILNSIEGTTIQGVAKYDGTWSSFADINVGQFGTGDVLSLTTYDDGTSSSLVIGGYFTSVSGVSANSIVRWDGTNFVALGSGVEGYYNVGVEAVATFDDGIDAFPGLYAAGVFFTAGGVPSTGWARWSPNGWSALPTGVFSARDLTVGTVNGVESLYIASSFFSQGSLRAGASWDGTTLTPLAAAGMDPESIAVYAGDLYVGSDFVGINETAHGVHPNGLARLDGAQWRGAVNGLGIGARFDAVRAFTTHDFGSGSELVAAGKFASVAGQATALIARFNGTSWAPVGEGITTWFIGALHEHDDGTGKALYAAGYRQGLGGQSLPAVRFDGTDWQPVGSGFDSFGEGMDFATYDEGGVPQLFLGGEYISIGGTSTRLLARWDGSVWSAVGSGLTGGGTFAAAAALTVFDDGTGKALYVGGRFTGAGGTPAQHIARWDGAAWSALGLGVDCLTSLAAPCILDMIVWDSPTGEVLVVTGYISEAGGQPVGGIAQWDGSVWSPLGTGLQNSTDLTAGFSLAAYDPDGLGERLYVGGRFDSAGGVPVNRFAVWDGFQWSAGPDPEGGTSGPLALEVVDDGSGRALYVGGSFQSLGGTPASNITRLTDPCGPSAGIPTCTSLPNSTGQSGLLRATGTSSVSSASLTLTARRLPAGVPTLSFFGSNAIQLPFGEGVRCVGGNVQRVSPPAFADNTGTTNLAINFGAAYGSAFTPGAEWLFQTWYRDNAGGPSGFNTTDALAIEFRP